MPSGNKIHCVYSRETLFDAFHALISINLPINWPIVEYPADIHQTEINNRIGVSAMTWNKANDQWITAGWGQAVSSTVTELKFIGLLRCQLILQMKWLIAVSCRRRWTGSDYQQRTENPYLCQTAILSVVQRERWYDPWFVGKATSNAFSVSAFYSFIRNDRLAEIMDSSRYYNVILIHIMHEITIPKWNNWLPT